MPDMLKIDPRENQNYLRKLSLNDLAAFENYYLSNASHLAPWEPVYQVDYRTRLSNIWLEDQNGTAFYFGIFSIEDDELLGIFNFTGITRGNFQSCYLGYSLAEEAQGMGIMTRALQIGIRFMFEDQGIHRIIACYQPENLKSQRLLQRLEFEQEGYAKSYLFIAGKWQDHVLTALVNPGQR